MFSFISMPTSEIIFKDRDGFNYKHPERSCKRCLLYPCLPNMDKLLGDFGAYGCKKYKDSNTFD